MDIVGIPTDEIFRRLYPEVPDDKQAELLGICQEELSGMVRRGGGLLFDGVPRTVKTLHDDGYRLFAASNGTCEYITAILETHGLLDYFVMPLIVIGGHIKSKSDIVRHYVENVLDTEPVIMVGDRFSDLKGRQRQWHSLYRGVRSDTWDRLK